ncbi:MAG: hypothetical protein Q4D81_08355 [Eubacteriales bacterium]|nr:hypothetical protein [Eubacteriales bacterium]
MNDLKNLNDQNKDGKNYFRRVAAMLAIVLLAGLYILTFILAVLGDERSTQLLRFCFGLTIFLPIFLWVVIWCVGFLRHKRTMASLDILNSNPEERRKMEEAAANVQKDNCPEE